MSTLSTNRALSVGLLTAALSAGLSAQGSFLHLPSGAGTAYAVSDDGTVVAGWGSGGVFRWAAVGGMQYLNLRGSGLIDLSADGSVVMANMLGSESPSGFGEAATWTQGGGWTNIGGLIGNSCGTLSSGYSMSKDGKVIVGLAWASCRGRAFRWDAQNGMIDLGLLGTSLIASARANVVSGDGAVIGGWDTAANGTRRAAVWFPIGTSYSEMLIIPPSPSNPDGGGEVWGMNQSGSVIVGESGDAWRWKNGVFMSLGQLAGFQPGDSGAAHDTNADGSMIVGNSGSVLSGFDTFMWTEEDGIQKMEQFLADQEIAIPSGGAMSWLLDITPSGYHIVGRRGGFPQQAFLIELPAGVRYGVRRGGTNTMRLAGTGSTSLGGTLTVTTDRITSANPLVSTLVGTQSTALPLFGGTLLVDLAQPHVVVNGVQSAGASTFNISIPNVPAAVGASFYMQSVVIDPSAGGMLFSNGIKSTIVE